MSNKLEHKFIRMLNFAYENERFTKKQLVEQCKIPEEVFERHKESSLGRPDELTIYRPFRKKDGSAEDEYEITYPACMNYLEYIELKHSLESSKQAKWIAIAAIIVSVLVSFVSLWIQISRPGTVRIDDAQVEEFKSAMPSILEK